MLLVERFWTAVTAVLGVFTFSPAGNNGYVQSPLDMSLEGVSAMPEPGHATVITPPTIKDSKNNGKLIFHPPGTDTDFKCDYSAMEGWEQCSTETDRKCWLRKSDGSEHPFDIYTDYETRAPKGITRYYNLDLVNTTHDKDGYPFTEAKLFNGEYPGPWIQACWGDRIVVTVKNSLPYNGTSVHWHGIRQLNTMHMDGVNGVTQCPIATGDYFVYNFTTMQYGSSWYHSHYSVQYADGAHGGMTIHGPTSEPWDEAVSPPLIMTDWAHNSAFTSISGGAVMPNILLDGKGNVTRFNNDNKNTTKIHEAFTINFEPPKLGQRIKRYLLRIINTSFDTTFLFSIDNHWLTVVEADFVPIQSYRTNKLMVGIGQRYDVVVEAWPQADVNKTIEKDGNYWIRTFIVPKCFAGFKTPKTSIGYEQTGILRYNKASTVDPTSEKWSNIDLKTINCSDPTIYRYYDIHPVVPWTVEKPSNYFPFTDNYVLDGPDSGLKTHYPLARWTLGVNPSVPIRVDYSNPTFLNLNATRYPQEWRMEMLNFNASEKKSNWVYLVIETTGSNHPIHLHGHDYAIIDAQSRPFDPNRVNLELNNPPRRDVVMLPSGDDGGYIVIAFKIDNPGAWLVHCHIAFHISEGLGMQLMEDQPNANRIWPPDDSAIVEAERVCKNWRKWVNDTGNHFPETCPGIPLDQCFQNDSGV